MTEVNDSLNGMSLRHELAEAIVLGRHDGISADAIADACLAVMARRFSVSTEELNMMRCIEAVDNMSLHRELLFSCEPLPKPPTPKAHP